LLTGRASSGRIDRVDSKGVLTMAKGAFSNVNAIFLVRQIKRFRHQLPQRHFLSSCNLHLDKFNAGGVG